MTPSEVVILFGGPSSERKVSVASAQNFANHLPQARTWFWAPGGEVYEVSRASLLDHADPFTAEFVAPPGSPVSDHCRRAFAQAPRHTVFALALHGIGGEDGTVQEWLEDQNLAFTGSNSSACKRAFDKACTKKLAAEADVRLARSILVDPTRAADAERDLSALLSIAPRVVLKPVADGSSHGVFFASNAARAVAELKSRTVPYLAEEFVSGREITVGVYDAPEGLRALPISEVQVATGREFDYEGKYLGVGTREITPAQLDDPTRIAAQESALRVHRAVGCEGYSRTDMIIPVEGNGVHGRPVVLEINNLPGMTKASFFPQQLAAAGIPVAGFFQRILELARLRNR